MKDYIRELGHWLNNWSGRPGVVLHYNARLQTYDGLSVLAFTEYKPRRYKDASFEFIISHSHNGPPILEVSTPFFVTAEAEALAEYQKKCALCAEIVEDFYKTFKDANE
jgi:hypothetical protein